RRVMPAKTSAASAICGTHLGLTNAETSITEWPASAGLVTHAILWLVGTDAASFCGPSRGPTSTIRTGGIPAGFPLVEKRAHPFLALRGRAPCGNRLRGQSDHVLHRPVRTR